jgi:hypothetical protein
VRQFRENKMAGSNGTFFANNDVLIFLTAADIRFALAIFASLACSWFGERICCFIACVET